MVTIYREDLYCDACGRDITQQHIDSEDYPPYWTPIERGRAKSRWQDGYDEPGLDFDSNDWPSIGHPKHPTNYPEHCAAGAQCLNAIDLTDYGLPTDAPLYGAENRSVGALLGDQLTEEGRHYIAECLKEPDRTLTPHQQALHALWREGF